MYVSLLDCVCVCSQAEPRIMYESHGGCSWDQRIKYSLLITGLTLGFCPIDDSVSDVSACVECFT